LANKAEEEVLPWQKKKEGLSPQPGNKQTGDFGFFSSLVNRCKCCRRTTHRWNELKRIEGRGKDRNVQFGHCVGGGKGFVAGVTITLLGRARTNQRTRVVRKRRGEVGFFDSRTKQKKKKQKAHRVLNGGTKHNWVVQKYRNPKGSVCAREEETTTKSAAVLASAQRGKGRKKKRLSPELKGRRWGRLFEGTGSKLQVPRGDHAHETAWRRYIRLGDR